MDITISKYLKENSKPKHSKSTFCMKKRASDRTFHELGSANWSETVQKRCLACISRFAIFIDISLQIKDNSVKWKTYHNQTTISLHFHWKITNTYIKGDKTLTLTSFAIFTWLEETYCLAVSMVGIWWGSKVLTTLSTDFLTIIICVSLLRRPSCQAGFNNSLTNQTNG